MKESDAAQKKKKSKDAKFETRKAINTYQETTETRGKEEQNEMNHDIT